MKKSRTTNTFEQGMIMDFNPSVTPNNVLTNCLNGTLLTFNGNENVLQQDQGNGRVETAYLPEGYIPVGTAELGGIIYIVSYNPQTNKSQIGSFPSPERNLSTEEIPTSDITVSNSQFTDGSKVLNTLLRVKLLTNSDISKLNPGDKYIIYSTNNGITSNQNCLSDVGNVNHRFGDIPNNVTIHVVSIGEDGKITYLDDTLKWDTGLNYYIRESSTDQEGQWDIDEYRTLTSTAYNIFNSKVSGELALLFELQVIDSFSVTWDATVNTIQEGENDKEAVITFNINYTSSHPDINLKYILLEGSEFNSETPTNLHCDISQETLERVNDGTDPDIPIQVGTFKYNSQNNLNDYIWNYKVTPSMQFGQLDFLATQGFINFSEIGSGKIQLDEWRYFIQDSNFYLNWGLSAYLEKNKTISKIIFTFIPFDSINSQEITNGDPEVMYTSYPQYIISGKTTYSGFFKELINFGESSKIQNGVINKDYLYLVDICIVYADQYIHIYRWLYTTGQWNTEYSSISDFKSLSLTDTIQFSSKSLVTDNISLDTIVYESNVTLPSELSEIDTPYQYMGAQITTVGYNQKSGFSNNPNVTAQTIVECSQSNLFSFNSLDSDNYEFNIKETSISHDDFTPISDKLSNISLYVIPKIAEQNDKYQITMPDNLSSTISTIITQGIKSDTDSIAIDSFSTTIQSVNKNSVSIAVKGALFSRINADLIKSTIQAEQLIRPLLYYTDDYKLLGFIRDDNNLNLFEESQYDAGRGEPFSFIFSNRNNQSERVDSWKDLKWDPTDRFELQNWYEVEPYAYYLNSWMMSKGGAFQIMHWIGDQNKEDSIRFGDLGITGYVSIWGKTTEGRFIPLNYFIPSNPQGEEDLNNVIKSFYTSVYYVDTNGTQLDTILVDNINYMHLYNETWNIIITPQLVVKDMNQNLVLDNKCSLLELQEECKSIQNSDDTLLDLRNIMFDTEQISLEDIKFSHTFYINNSNLYNIYSDNKSGYTGAVAILSNEVGIKKCPTQNQEHLYVYDRSKNDFTKLNNSCYSKTYQSTDLGTTTSELNSQKQRVIVKSGTPTPSRPIELYNAVKYINGEVVLDEGVLTRSVVPMHFKTTSTEHDGGKTSQIKINSAFGLT